MTSLMSKSSLYDMVSMIIPGFLFILCVEIASGIGLGCNFSTPMSGIITFTLSYILGIIIHLVSKDIFRPVLREDKELIDKALDKYKDEEKVKNEPLNEYNEQYYYLFRDYTNKVVSIIETQVAFLRSILIVIPTAIVALLVYGIANCSLNNPNRSLLVYGIVMVIVVMCIIKCPILFKCKKLHKLFICIKRYLWQKRWIPSKCCIFIKLVLIAIPLFIFLLTDGKKDIGDIFPSKDYYVAFIVLLFLGEILLYCITRKRQEEIVNLVAEGRYYVHKIKEDEKDCK